MSQWKILSTVDWWEMSENYSIKKLFISFHNSLMLVANIAVVVAIEWLVRFDCSLGIAAGQDRHLMPVHYIVVDIAVVVAVAGLVEPSKLPISVLQPRPQRQSSFVIPLVYFLDTQMRRKECTLIPHASICIKLVFFVYLLIPLWSLIWCDWKMITNRLESIGIGLVWEWNLLTFRWCVAEAADGDLFGVVWVLGIWVVKVTYFLKN